MRFRWVLGILFFCRFFIVLFLFLSLQVRVGEFLMKLVFDFKQFFIFNDFSSVNEVIDQRNQQLRALQEECDRKFIILRDEIFIDLYELEEEYYLFRYRQGWIFYGAEFVDLGVVSSCGLV